MMTDRKKSTKRLATKKPNGFSTASKLGRASGARKASSPPAKARKRRGPGGGATFSHTLPPKGLTFDAMLHRQRRRGRDEKKETKGRLKDEVPLSVMDSDSLSMMSEGITPWTTYNITLKGFSTVTSSASGVFAFSVPADPSSAGYNFSEWSDLAALFGEVRILAFEIQMCTYRNLATAVTAATPVIVGFNSNGSAAPTTEGQVATLVESRYWAAYSDATTAGSRFSVRYDSRLDFSLTSSVTDTPYAGCPGSFQAYGTGFPNSSSDAKVLVLGLYQFRARQ